MNINRAGNEPKRHHFEIFADYYQIFIEDMDNCIQREVNWSDKQIMAKLYTYENGFIIGTVRNLDVPLTIEVYPEKPNVNVEAFDHLNLTCFEVTGDGIFISGTTDYVADFHKLQLSKGHYGAYVGHKGLSSISEDGLEGDDAYFVWLWRVKQQFEPVVLKQSQ